jgi:hypothetical protein
MMSETIRRTAAALALLALAATWASYLLGYWP